MIAWTAGDTWVCDREVHDQGRKHVYRLRIIEPIPVDWAVILGEAIHDLRSALDQAIYWLTIDWSGQEVRGSSFPVYTRKTAFYEKRRKTGDWSSSGGMYKIRGVGPGPQAFVEALQPYPQQMRHPYCRALRTVHDLWNQDKHRLVHLWGLRFDDSHLRFEPDFAADCEIGIDRRVLHDRAIVLRATCRTTHPEMKVTGPIEASVAIFTGKARVGRTDSLWDTASIVADTIRKLTSAIGRQREAINLQIWTDTTPVSVAGW
ncbi:MAG: hypothetical protein QOG70_2758 [Solirubrobacteraceae bacterium]|jgi:hypothetical protein|nr:hypothetical protein [Solirubrobacteraceae bacterium]